MTGETVWKTLRGTVQENHKRWETIHHCPLTCVCLCVRVCVCVCVCERERERDTEGVVVVLKEHSVWIKVTLFVSLFVSASTITNVLRLLAFFPVPFWSSLEELSIFPKLHIKSCFNFHCFNAATDWGVRSKSNIWGVVFFSSLATLLTYFSNPSTVLHKSQLLWGGGGWHWRSLEALDTEWNWGKCMFGSPGDPKMLMWGEWAVAAGWQQGCQQGCGAVTTGDWCQLGR